jgi:hypothetical protein
MNLGSAGLAARATTGEVGKKKEEAGLKAGCSQDSGC